MCFLILLGQVEELEEVATRTSKINDRIAMFRRDVARGFRY
jgi:hypothetical protein